MSKLELTEQKLLSLLTRAMKQLRGLVEPSYNGPDCSLYEVSSLPFPIMYVHVELSGGNTTERPRAICTTINTYYTNPLCNELATALIIKLLGLYFKEQGVSVGLHEWVPDNYQRTIVIFSHPNKKSIAWGHDNFKTLPLTKLVPFLRWLITTLQSDKFTKTWNKLKKRHELPYKWRCRTRR